MVACARHRSCTVVSFTTTTDNCVPSEHPTSQCPSTAVVPQRTRCNQPEYRPSTPVPVHLGASLVEVLGLDEVRSHITLKIWLTLVRMVPTTSATFTAVSEKPRPWPQQHAYRKQHVELRCFDDVAVFGKKVERIFVILSMFNLRQVDCCFDMLDRALSTDSSVGLSLS